MGKSYSNPAVFASAFEVQATKPLDARFVLDNVADLTNGTIDYPYVGLVVNIKGTDQLYVLTALDADPTGDNHTWKKVGSEKADNFTIGRGLSWGGTNNRELQVTLDTTLFVIVSGSTLPSKPSTGNENKIHILQRNDDGSGKNTYDEYIFVNNKWELLGSVRSNVDMSNYYDKSEINSKVETLQTGIDNVSVPTLKIGTVSEGSASAQITGTTPNNFRNNR